MKKQEQSMNLEAEAYCKKLKKVASSSCLPWLRYILIKFLLCLISLQEKIFKLFSLQSPQDLINLRYTLKYVVFMNDILLPLIFILDAIIENRNFDIYFKLYNKSLPDSLKGNCSIDDIYNLLKQTPKSITQKKLRETSPDLLRGEHLIHVFYTSDKENFIRTLLNGDYNLQIIKEFCNIYGNKIQKQRLWDKLSGRWIDNNEVLEFEAERNINEYIKIGKLNALVKILNQLIKGNTKVSKRDMYSLTRSSFILHFLLMDEYTSFEKKVVDRIIKRINRKPYYKKVYDKIYSIYQKEKSEYFNERDFSSFLDSLAQELPEIESETPQKINSVDKPEPYADSSVKVSDIIDVNNNEDFFLDEDYFVNQQPVDDDNIYFSKLKESVKSEGGTKFMEFINWLAEEGYIDNKSKTKAMLAFRLTGICPPKELEEKIEWKINVNNLAYIIRYFYPQKSKWSKVNIFFSSTLQKFNSLSSSYADNVDEQFKNKIREFYPNIEGKE